MHQPASPRINGAGRGRFNPHRGGGPSYHYHPLPQHHMPPQAIPVQSPPPVSPASPYHHPQKFAPHPHPHQVPYGSPYHHPQANGPYPPTWPGQTLSPLPKQMSMLPPMVSPEHVPQMHIPQLPHQQHPLQHQPPVMSQTHMSPEISQHMQPVPLQVIEARGPRIASPSVAPFVPRFLQVAQPPPELLQPEPPVSDPVQFEVPQFEGPVVQEQPEETLAVPLPDAAESEPQAVSPEPEVVAETLEQVEDRVSRPATPRSPSPGPTPSSSFVSSYVVWSRRPGDPGRAPGVIISTHAYPPQDVAQKALELPSPAASPKPRRVTLPQPSVPAADNADASSDSTTALSVSTTETTPAGSTTADTPVPGSPYSCATSISVAVGSPSASQAPKSPVSPRVEAKAELPVTNAAVTEPTTATETSAPQATSEATIAPAASSSAPAAPAKPVPGPKKSWASLLHSGDSTASSSKPRLPVSNVVGFSIPAASGGSTPSAPGISVATANRNELLHLINNGPSGSSANVAAAMKIRPRGLVNTGNMCFANAVLQILVYCPPFHRFFSELRKHLAGPVVGSQREGSKATPLVDATIQFLKEFVPDPPSPNADSRSKGKEREEDIFDELDSFIPTYVYDAMKEKKRFANMIVSSTLRRPLSVLLTNCVLKL